LTPNHFLKFHHNCLPPAADVPSDGNLRKQWRITQQIANNFWSRWQREILPEMARRSKWFTSTSTINVNDIVLITDKNIPRPQWRKGKIEKLVYGQDNIARVAIVKSNNKFYKRPVNKLAKLDLISN
jgi:hypothetical protein